MIIENEKVRLEVVEHGGEIQSFYDLTHQLEYMWQGDAAFWSGKNPSLFPMVSNTWTKDYEWQGQRYAMKNHGLVRYADLKCVKHTADEIVMELNENEDTLKQYPFHFTFQIHYRLNGKRLDVVYHITNDSEDVMPFSFGLHPGFNCPLLPGEKFSDYKLVFPQDEQPKQLAFHGRHEIIDRSFKEIALNYELFEEYATLVYKDIKSPYVELVGPKHKVRVGCLGYPFLAFWTAKRDAPFICIEPWYGHGDFEEVNCSFDQREGTMNLKPHEGFTTSYFIELF